MIADTFVGVHKAAHCGLFSSHNSSLTICITTKKEITKQANFVCGFQTSLWESEVCVVDALTC